MAFVGRGGCALYHNHINILPIEAFICVNCDLYELVLMAIGSLLQQELRKVIHSSSWGKLRR